MISKTQEDDFLNLDVEQFKKNPMYKVFKIIHRCLYLHVILQDEWMDVFIYIYWYSHIDYLILCDYIYIYIYRWATYTLFSPLGGVKPAGQ